MIKMELSELIGIRTLDGRGEWVNAGDRSRWEEDAMSVVLRLDGVMYEFKEDPGDGYRSGLNYVRVIEPDALPAGSFVEFYPRTVGLTLQTKSGDEPYASVDDILIGTDEATGCELFRIGTTNLDDYYPGFVHSWTPVSP